MTIRAMIDEPNAFIVELSGSLSFRQTVDVVGWFNGLSEGARKHYVDLNKENEQGYATWEMPFAYLCNFLWEGLEIDGALGPASADSLDVDIDDIQGRFVKRPDKPAYVSPKQVPEDFDLLLARVPWLATAHRIIERGTDELTEEEVADLARVPGPNDTPLEF